jgi:hypothetical protein
MKVALYPIFCMMLLIGCGKSTTNSVPVDLNTSADMNSGTNPSSPGSFQNLVRGDAYSSGLETPAIFIAGNSDEAKTLSGLVDSAEDVKLIQEVDFAKHRIVAVFRGEVGTAGYGISIDKIQSTDGAVRLSVTLSDPAPDEAVAQVVSYPYHLVTIPRDDLNGNEESVWTVYASDDKMLTEAKYPEREKNIEEEDENSTGNPGTTTPTSGDITDSSGPIGTVATDHDGKQAVTSGSTGTTSSSDGLTEDNETNDGRTVPIGSYTGDDEPVSSDDPRVKPLPPPIVPGNDNRGITNPKEGGPLPPVGRKLDIRGSVITVGDPSAGAKEHGILGSVLIEGLRADDTNFDKAVVTITESTRILHWDGEEMRESDFSSLKSGQSVEARFQGPVMESYPVQATAMEIVIMN